MKLNDMHPGEGARAPRKRVGRGPGSGRGKTAGRGHKGQKARSGGLTKLGFEGGQMPLQRRVPKRGFRRADDATAQLRLDALNAVAGEVDLASLKKAGLVAREARVVKVIASGTLSKAITLKGIRASAGAVKAIEAAGGQVAE